MIKKILLTLTIVLAGTAMLRPALAYADTCDSGDTKAAIGCGISGGSGKDESGDSTNRLNNLVKDLLQILSAVVGVLAVIMLIVGGARYIASGGGDQAVAAAKKTITYAIIGLIVVALSQFMVHFVLSKTSKAVNNNDKPSSMINRLTQA